MFTSTNVPCRLSQFSVGYQGAQLWKSYNQITIQSTSLINNKYKLRNILCLMLLWFYVCLLFDPVFTSAYFCGSHDFIIHHICS